MTLVNRHKAAPQTLTLKQNRPRGFTHEREHSFDPNNLIFYLESNFQKIIKLDGRKLSWCHCKNITNTTQNMWYEWIKVFTLRSGMLNLLLVERLLVRVVAVISLSHVCWHVFSPGAEINQNSVMAAGEQDINVWRQEEVHHFSELGLVFFVSVHRSPLKFAYNSRNDPIKCLKSKTK